ncbi:potassium transporter KefB [Pedobacter sp. KBW06]|uniref:potassium transporter KefB n=1 Tax=Pedobacter sp. KBW06 TaxID=2153359 RepID=UPI000F5A3C57|nr:potassium transporter KefB [Pedobacter sp. KBW06]RQO74968.1 potassium transporter KefB [Pedobacter sp. KBW06]
MTQRKNLTAQSVHPVSLGGRLLLGAGIAFIIITVFLLQVRKANPEWGELWMLRPLIIVPIAGAMGAAFYFFMDHLRDEGGWKKIFANALSLLVYIIALWLGTVLGLAGTLWN